MITLIKPSKKIEKEIVEYKQEFIDNKEKRINGSCGLIHYDNFDEWLEIVLSIEKEKLSKDLVHASTFFTMDKLDHKIIGSIQLRHNLTEELATFGGHIGYAIRPSQRNKGYGKLQLQLVLEVAKNMRLEKVMISCNSNNLASKRLIVNSGGILENKILKNDEKIEIYWIKL